MMQWVPHTSGLRVGVLVSLMPKRLKRYYGRGDPQFLTFSCYRRLPLLGTMHARNAFMVISQAKGQFKVWTALFAASGFHWGTGCAKRGYAKGNRG
jgi:hypothetical protein